MSNSFVISQVSWLTKTTGNEGRRDSIVLHFYHIAKFLQDNRLTVRNLVRTADSITDDFAIRSDDLTDEGLSVMKAGYDKWLRKVDQGMTPTDLSLMERALERVRKG